MTRQFNMHEAKTRLSQLVQQAADGQEIIIAKAGKPVACLVAYRRPQAARKPGYWRDRVQIQSDFDTLPAELASAFGGHAD